MEENEVFPSSWEPENSIIKVIGVGGAGCNAVSYMYSKKIKGCSFIACNTDKQALDKSPVPNKLAIGVLGAGTDPTQGRNYAIENQKAIEDSILGSNTKMLFITAGMGGGTGTGASPVIAKIAKDNGILTVAVVTLPFKDEKNGSYGKAIDGIRELEGVVDSLLVIDNQKIIETYPDLLLHEAFPKTDEVLATAVKSIIEIIDKEGYINVDFQDVQNMMRNSGFALMGTGVGTGPNRIEQAVKNAMESPLLLAFDPTTAQNALINITVGRNEKGIRAADLSAINAEVANYLGKANTFKRGIAYEDDPAFGDQVQVTIIATGIKTSILNGPIDFNEGSLIFIDENYKYQRFNRGQEVILPENKKSTNALRNGSRKFWYDQKPLLCVKPDEDMSGIIRDTAVKRALKKLSKD